MISTQTTNPNSKLLEIDNLHVHFRDGKGLAKAVNGVSFSIKKGETLAIVGESGCGKSVTAQAIMRLLPKTAGHPLGHILFKGEDLLKLGPEAMNEIRGRHISMVFQEPQTSLNPVFTIGNQVMEPLIKHLGLTEAEAYQRVVKLLGKMGLRDPEKIMSSYPHQFSGGMRQRVVIAMAMACEPDLLICDEPTTALDVTIQAQVLNLLKDLQKETGMAILLITHDLAIVHQMSARVLVMYSGQMSELGPTEQVLKYPRHPYTQKLLKCIPSGAAGGLSGELQVIPGRVRPAYDLPENGCFFYDRCERRIEKCRREAPFWSVHKDLMQVGAPGYLGHPVACWNPDLQAVQSILSDKMTGPKGSVAKQDSEKSSGWDSETSLSGALEVNQLQVNFKTGSQWPWPLGDKVKKFVHAVDHVDLRLKKGKTLALVGESGCGKSTLGHAILRLLSEAQGRVVFHGKNLLDLEPDELRPLRKHLQIIFQDPFSSLNPRMSVREILSEGLKVHFLEQENQFEQMMKDTVLEVGLPEDSLDRYPHQFSGGQRQRLALARALILKPDVMILDEATSALDVSLQAQILNLLKDLQVKRGLTYLFITHDMGSVSFLAHEVAVMYLGRIVEFGDKENVIYKPTHPYTQGLLAAVPSFHRPLEAQVMGDIPSPIDRPSGCFFHPRCKALHNRRGSDFEKRCQSRYPEMKVTGDHVKVACYLVSE
jgi:peptide/nickel transport system ATP-binding protein